MKIVYCPYYDRPLGTPTCPLGAFLRVTGYVTKSNNNQPH